MSLEPIKQIWVFLILFAVLSILKIIESFSARKKVHQTILRAERIFGVFLHNRKRRLRILRRHLPHTHNVSAAERLIRSHIYVHENFGNLAMMNFIFLFMIMGAGSILFKSIIEQGALNSILFTIVTLWLSFAVALLNLAIEWLRLYFEQMEAGASKAKTKGPPP